MTMSVARSPPAGGGVRLRDALRSPVAAATVVGLVASSAGLGVALAGAHYAFAVVYVGVTLAYAYAADRSLSEVTPR